MNAREYEQEHVQQTSALIQQEIVFLDSQKKKTKEKFDTDMLENAGQRIQGGSFEALAETMADTRQHEAELLVRYQSLASQEKRQRALRLMLENPYFARIDFKEDQEAETLYLGIASLRDLQEETVVIDWRAPIANLYYEGTLGQTQYEAHDAIIPIELLLKRQFKIREGHILSMVDTSEAINDDFLLEILDEASSNHMKNIVATIQRSQNEIIRDTRSKVLVVEGIAGSGKTSALLQRVAYLLYHNRKWLDNEQVLLFSPNHIFSDYISTVLPSLGESGIPTETFKTFLSALLPTYQIHTEESHEEVFLSGQDDRVLRTKSSFAIVQELYKYVDRITEFGPLFRDLKLNQEVLISKKQIRNWYQEANPELPMYQRMQLLQTKLLKKIGGLEKDEMKKDWVKKAADELVEAVFVNNPNMEDSEKAERRLRRQMAQKIVRKKMRPIRRMINRFGFINYAKQYLHFLQSIPNQLLTRYQLTDENWKDMLEALRTDFKQKDISLEDGTLMFLLMKSIHPLDVKQKARFIFIDEMQDFPPAQVALLRQLYPKAGITLCGDLNQKVYGNETIVGALAELFPHESVKRYQLKTSYRSTKEITDFANQFLVGSDQVELTARKGAVPTIVKGTATENLAFLETSIRDAAENQRWRTAIICKTAKDCQQLYAQLAETMQEQVQLITSEEDFMKRNVMIFPAFLAKGLEFDQVFVWTPGATFVTEQDQLIFYTMATRAMHQLTVLTQEELPLLAKADPTTYQFQEASTIG